MSALKIKTIDDVIEIEGGFVNDSDDSGGATNFGITEEVARRYGYNYKIESLPRSLAFEIYSKKYWDALNLDAIEKLSPLIAQELVDTGINQGIGRAGEFLQRSLNVLNNRGTYFDDVVVDGDVGKKTLKALSSYLKMRGSRGEKVLYKMLNCLQGSFYITLSERRSKDEKFTFGWFENRVS